jgi:hypothetical protein
MKASLFAALKPAQPKQEVKYNKIRKYLSSLSKADMTKIGKTVDELIQDYENVPFDFSEEDFIESIKCQL